MDRISVRPAVFPRASRLRRGRHSRASSFRCGCLGENDQRLTTICRARTGGYQAMRRHQTARGSPRLLPSRVGRNSLRGCFAVSFMSAFHLSVGRPCSLTPFFISTGLSDSTSAPSRYTIVRSPLRHLALLYQLPSALYHRSGLQNGRRTIHHVHCHVYSIVCHLVF
jgi:hypothetical protein